MQILVMLSQALREQSQTACLPEANRQASGIRYQTQHKQLRVLIQLQPQIT
ncbi:hypothetical protein D3C73_1386000 [compost metagenome]